MDRRKRGALAEFELRGHFHGKRSGVRVRQYLEVILHGAVASFHAHALDISRTGIRIGITDPSRGAELDLTGFAADVAEHFGDGVNIALPGKSPRRAFLVRVSVDEGQLGVAFHFKRPLSKRLCKRLGIPLDADSDPEAGF